MFDNLDLSDEFQMLEDKFGGEKRELTKPEVMEILKLTKRIFRLSYGERSADGERFKPGVDYPEVWEDFHTSAAYDAVLWDLYSHPDDIFAFMAEIMPKSLREAAAAEAEKRKAPQDHLPKHVADKPAAEQNVFDEHKDETPTAEDLTALTDDEFRARIAGREMHDLSKDEMVEMVRRSGIPTV